MSLVPVRILGSVIHAQLDSGLVTDLAIAEHGSEIKALQNNLSTYLLQLLPTQYLKMKFKKKKT